VGRSLLLELPGQSASRSTARPLGTLPHTSALIAGYLSPAPPLGMSANHELQESMIRPACLLPHAMKVKVAHPLMLRAIAAKKKNDKINAARIAGLRAGSIVNC
jgi:hypothetical protein